jgi:uncharacterized membrane protein
VLEETIEYKQRRERYWLALILIVAAAVRVYGIGDACYWKDEFNSLEVSTGRGLLDTALPVNVKIDAPPALTTLEQAPPWWRLWTSLDRDNHPPLYFLLLRSWRMAVGDGEANVRLMSALFSLGAVVSLYLAVRVHLSASAALFATAIMAVASPQVHFAQEARGYALWSMLAMACAATVIMIERDGASLLKLTGLAIAALGMLLTHYFAIAVVCSLLLYSIWKLTGPERRRTVIALLLACAIYALIWGPFQLKQRATLAENNQWQIDPVKYHIASTLRRLALLPLRWLSESAIMRFPIPWVIVISAVVIVIAAAGLYFVCHTRAGAFWTVFATPLVMLLLALDLLRHSRHLEVSRYTFVAGPAVYAMIGAWAGRVRWRWIVPALVVVFCGWSLSGAYSDMKDWRLVADALRDESAASDVVVYASGGRENSWAGSLYLGLTHYAPELRRHPTILMTDPDQAAERIENARGTGSVWLVCANAAVAPEHLLPRYSTVQTIVVPNVGRVSQMRPARN